MIWFWIPLFVLACVAVGHSALSIPDMKTPGTRAAGWAFVVMNAFAASLSAWAIWVLL